MTVPATVGAFLAVVRKSNQIDPSRLESYLQTSREELPSQPRKLAVQMIREGLLTRFQAEQFLLGKYKGFSLGGYRILERLGKGGAGTVYLGEHEVMKRRVAIKVLPTPCADSPALLERFKREARASALLDHPNVVHVYDLRQEGPLHYIVMEYVAGPTLHQLVARRGPLPVVMACDYIRQAAHGLQHIHEAGLVHRDIKPANILVDATGTIKVMDLGLARYEPQGEQSLTHKFNNKMVLGTADYLSPEQALDLHDVDGRADIYSLGATLYTLLTGKPPFHDGTIGQKLMWHQSREPRPVHELRPEVPVELSAIVTRMLAKRPMDRYQSAAEVAEALLPWLDGTGQIFAPSSRTLTEISLDSRSPRGAQGSQRLMPPDSADTTVGLNASHSTSDTHLTLAPEVVPVATQAAPGPSAWKFFPALVGLAGTLAVVVAGIASCLAWLG